MSEPRPSEDHPDAPLLASVVVVNKDDAGIANTLRALEGLDDARVFEVIVVDASEGRLEAVRSAFPRVHWIDYAHPTGKPRTIAEQRNLGVERSTGGIVVFLDANCVPAEGWLDFLLAPIASGAEEIVVGSAVSAGGPSVHDTDKPMRPGTYLDECANMNVAYRRTVFDRVGYFDERLDFAEDVDFAWRAIDAGLRLCYEPRAVVSHDWGNASENFPRAFRYGVARVRLLRKHRSRLRRLAGSDRYVLAYALYLALLPIAVFFPAYLLVLAYPLMKNRRHKPFETVAYHLTYGAGALSEFLHIPVTKGQREWKRSPA